MEQPIVDLGFLYELSANEPGYIFDVINLFMEVMPEGLNKLEAIAKTTDDFDAIHKQAHYLKSSAAIIKISGMYDDLAKIVSLSRENRGKEEIIERVDHILGNFKEAEPLILAERAKCDAARKK